MAKGKVLIAAPVHDVLIKGLSDAGYELVLAEKISQASAAQYMSDCVGIVTSTRLHLDKSLLDLAPGLQWIGRMGSGMEVINVAYAAEKGIKCFSSPEGNSNAVAEHAVGLLLALSKRIFISNNQLKDGIWDREGNRGSELENKTIGIIGFGHTGRAFAKKLLGFDMQILVYDKYAKDEIPEYVTSTSLEVIQQQADIISFHVPLQEDTIHYFNNKFISGMNKGFILLNTSRGIVADVDAIKKGLDSGKIKAAGLDVWEEEPLEQMSIEMRTKLDEMIKMPQVIITPHIAGYSFEALYKMSKVLLAKIVSI